MEPTRLATDETVRLIASDKVEGTAVFDTEATHIGEVRSVMIDKITGQVAYVVIGFGGFLGIGADHYPIPWKKLRYSEELGGYVVEIARDRLEAAPHYAGDAPPWAEGGFGQSIHDYYNVPYYM